MGEGVGGGVREKMVIWEGVGESGCGSGGGSEREDGDMGRCRRVGEGGSWGEDGDVGRCRRVQMREWGRE